MSSNTDFNILMKEIHKKKKYNVIYVGKSYVLIKQDVHYWVKKDQMHLLK